MTTWQHWVNFILGVWLIISAYVGMTATGITTNLVVVGIVVAVLGLWGGIQNRAEIEEQRHSHA